MRSIHRSAGWLSASQQCFSLKPIQHQPPASQQYFSLTTNQHSHQPAERGPSFEGFMETNLMVQL
jgi:hypothetical protein